MSLALFVVPRYAFQDDNGGPAAGWKLYTYAPGTSVAKTAYQDAQGVNAHANPIILDARGEATIYLDGLYRFVLQDTANNTKWTADDISGAGAPSRGLLKKNVGGSANVILTPSEQNHSCMEFIGALTGNIDVLVGDDRDGHRWLVKNSTTGNYTLTFKTPNSAGVVIPQGGLDDLYCDAATISLCGSGFVSNMAQLRLMQPTGSRRIYVEAWATPGDGGHGFFRAATGTYVDNGGTIIVPSESDGSSAWLREITGAYRPEWFGAVASDTTNATDATDAIQAATDAANAAGVMHVDLGGKSWRVSSTLVVRGESMRFGNGKLIPKPSSAWNPSAEGIPQNPVVLLNAAFQQAYSIAIPAASAANGILGKFYSQTIRDCSISGMPVYGIKMEGSGGHLRNNVVRQFEHGSEEAKTRDTRSAKGIWIVGDDCKSAGNVAYICAYPLYLEGKTFLSDGDHYWEAAAEGNEQATIPTTIIYVGPDSFNNTFSNLYADTGAIELHNTAQEFNGVKVVWVASRTTTTGLFRLVSNEPDKQWTNFVLQGISTREGPAHLFELVSNGANSWDVDPARLASMGVSSLIHSNGPHLASTLATEPTVLTLSALASCEAWLAMNGKNTTFSPSVGAVCDKFVVRTRGADVLRVHGDNTNNIVEVIDRFNAGKFGFRFVRQDGTDNGHLLSGGTTGHLEFGTVGTARWEMTETEFRPFGDVASSIGNSTHRAADVYSKRLRPGDGSVVWTTGTGSPEGVVVAPPGSLYTNTSGGAGTSLYVKESGTGNTGWVAK